MIHTIGGHPLPSENQKASDELNHTVSHSRQKFNSDSVSNQNNCRTDSMQIKKRWTWTFESSGKKKKIKKNQKETAEAECESADGRTPTDADTSTCAGPRLYLQSPPLGGSACRSVSSWPLYDLRPLFFFFFSWLPLGLILFVFSLPVFLAADPKKLLLLPPLEPPTASPAHRLAALLTVEKKEAYGFRIAVAVPSGSFSSS